MRLAAASVAAQVVHRPIRAGVRLQRSPARLLVPLPRPTRRVLALTPRRSSTSSPSGIPAPNLQDTTARECQVAGCEAVRRHRYRWGQFVSQHGGVERYARDRGPDQVATIVMSFAPPVSQVEQDRYWAEIEKLMA